MYERNYYRDTACSRVTGEACGQEKKAEIRESAHLRPGYRGWRIPNTAAVDGPGRTDRRNRKAAWPANNRSNLRTTPAIPKGRHCGR